VGLENKIKDILNLVYLSDLQHRISQEESYRLFKETLKTASENNFFIVLNGDYIYHLNSLYKALEELKSEKLPQIIINQGNHENIFEVLSQKSIEEKYPNVHYVIDPEIKELNGKRILFVPGAYRLIKPGNITRNEELPSGFYAIENKKFRKMSDKEVNELVEHYRKLKILYFQALEKGDSKEIQSILSEINFLNNSFIYNINPKEIYEKFRDKKIDLIISHDPPYIEGLDIDVAKYIKVKEDLNFNSNVVKKGEEIPLFAINKKTLEQLLREGKIELIDKHVGDPWLGKLIKENNIPFAIGGHLEGFNRVYDINGNEVSELNSSETFYANLSTPTYDRAPIFIHLGNNSFYSLNKERFIDKIGNIYGITDVEQEVKKENLKDRSYNVFENNFFDYLEDKYIKPLKGLYSKVREKFRGLYKEKIEKFKENGVFVKDKINVIFTRLKDLYNFYRNSLYKSFEKIKRLNFLTS
jgi:hypothetical protein